MTFCVKAEKPILCSRGCGFHGTPSNNNLCSLCYKAFLIVEEEAKKNVTVATLSGDMSSLTSDDDSGKTDEDVDSTIMKIKQRCMICKKKVGLTGFSCRCEGGGGMFCRFIDILKNMHALSISSLLAMLLWLRKILSAKLINLRIGSRTLLLFMFKFVWILFQILNIYFFLESTFNLMHLY
ncbi:hypothetical protein P3S68_004706 [Capsicum galapagoense]